MPIQLFRIFFILSFSILITFSTSAQSFNYSQGKAYFDRQPEDPLFQFIKSFTWAFTKYIEWPATPKRTFDIGLLQDTLLYDYMIQLKMEYGEVDGREIRVFKLDNLSQVYKMDILLAPPNIQYSYHDLYKSIKNSGVLVISEGWRSGFSMINFVVDKGRLKFEICPTILEWNGLIASSVLSDLSIKVSSNDTLLLDLYQMNSIFIPQFINDTIETRSEPKNKVLAQKIDDNWENMNPDDLIDLLQNEMKKSESLEYENTNLQVEVKKLKIESSKLEDQIASLNETRKEVEKEIAIQKTLNYSMATKSDSIFKRLKENQVFYDSVNREIKVKSQELNQASTKIKKAELKLKETNEILHNQEIVSYAIGAIAFLIGLLGIFAFVNFRRQKKMTEVISRQHDEVIKSHNQITEQKQELEVRNKQILDSIEYAKRIQNAILPPLKVVKEFLNDSFIIYLPKDVVAGDFYWFNSIDGKVLFAAADCTGHGVPGAMVSVICNNGLNRSVREYGLTDPGEILNKTREIVVSEFEKSEEEVKDGMDIAICSIEQNKLEYAGAHNPLIIIRKDAEECEVIKADKEPIGQFDNPKPYTTHRLEIKKGDSIYLFSDGFQDQFGGPKGKKFMISKFKKLLLDISKEPMEKQKELILEAFNVWKGKEEQVDDVCVIGVKI